MDESKDQTYFLFGLTQAQLARTLFPLGELTKPEVRELARSHGSGRGRQGRQPGDLLRAQRRLRRLHERLPEGEGRRRERTAGEIVTTDGRTLGEHEGVHHFTVGQRKGLGIATGEPLYVIATDPASQRVIVGGNDDLLRARFVAATSTGSPSPASSRRARARAGEDPQQARRRAGHALAAPATPTASKCVSTSRSAPSPPARARSSTTATWCWAAAGSNRDSQSPFLGLQ